MNAEDRDKPLEQVRLETESAERWHEFMERRERAANRALLMLTWLYDAGFVPEQYREQAKDIVEQGR